MKNHILVVRFHENLQSKLYFQQILEAQNNISKLGGFYFKDFLNTWNRAHHSKIQGDSHSLLAISGVSGVQKLFLTFFYYE